MLVKTALQKAIYLAQSGRPGPVWIDVPMDIQGAYLDEDILPSWDSSSYSDICALRGDTDLSPNTLSDFTIAGTEQIEASVDKILERLSESDTPVLFAGTGIRISGMTDSFRKLAENLGIPAVTGWNAHDLLPNTHPCYAGRPGTVGDRAGNFTVQNADFLLVLGCRLNIRQISYSWNNFANKAWKAHIDIDLAELTKPTLNSNLILQADLKDAMPVLLKKSLDWKIKNSHKEYLAWCKERVCKYPVVNKRHAESEILNPYHFMDQLFKNLDDDDVVVTANGSACVISFQTATIKESTRLFTNSGDASMGYDLPAAIGAAIAQNGKRVICLAGDGSIMMNLQELQTIVGYNLPIIIFVLDNNGYLSIRQTQTAYFSDNLAGIDKDTGVTFPDFIALANAFKIPAYTIENTADLDNQLTEILSTNGPVLCRVTLDEKQNFEPKLASRKLNDGTMISPELDDMAPFLSKDEMQRNRQI